MNWGRIATACIYISGAFLSAAITAIAVNSSIATAENGIWVAIFVILLSCLVSGFAAMTNLVFRLMSPQPQPHWRSVLHVIVLFTIPTQLIQFFVIRPYNTSLAIKAPLIGGLLAVLVIAVAHLNAYAHSDLKG